jgi:electron transfer flavoprotein beta subunit
MDVIVCVKRVPLTQEMDLEVDARKKDVRKEGLAWVINDWDRYAAEEAVRLKESVEGTVTAVTVGSEEDEEVLRRCLAMGADRAIRVDPGEVELDAFAVSRILAKVIKGMPFDLILTGVQATDDGYGMVGIMLAEQLGLARAAVVTGLELHGEGMIRCELEGGIEEVSRIELPALFSIQTGINEPRYVSIMGIKKAAKKSLEVINLDDLKLSDEDLRPSIMVEEVFLPPEMEGATIIEGEPKVVVEEIIRILREKGVNV